MLACDSYLAGVYALTALEYITNGTLSSDDKSSSILPTPHIFHFFFIVFTLISVHTALKPGQARFLNLLAFLLISLAYYTATYCYAAIYYPGLLLKAKAALHVFGIAANVVIVMAQRTIIAATNAVGKKKE